MLFVLSLGHEHPLACDVYLRQPFNACCTFQDTQVKLLNVTKFLNEVTKVEVYASVYQSLFELTSKAVSDPGRVPCDAARDVRCAGRRWLQGTPGTLAGEGLLGAWVPGLGGKVEAVPEQARAPSLLGWDPPLACASLKCPDSDPQACSLSVSLNLAVKEKKKAEG